MIKAVIFDMDGVLIDTEKHYNVAWCQAARDFGFDMTKEQALKLRSCDARLAQTMMQEIFGPEFDYYAIRERRREIVKDRLEQYGLEIKPGIEELMKFLHERDIKTAVATATPLELTREHLTKIGIYEQFDIVVSAKEVEHGKPAPDVYLYACEQIGEEPKDCMAIEDSPNGILAAYRAGCMPVMVPDLTLPDEEISKYLYGCAKNLADVINIINANHDQS